MKEEMCPSQQMRLSHAWLLTSISIELVKRILLKTESSDEAAGRIARTEGTDEVVVVPSVRR